MDDALEIFEQLPVSLFTVKVLIDLFQDAYTFKLQGPGSLITGTAFREDNFREWPCTAFFHQRRSRRPCQIAKERQQTGTLLFA